MLAERTKKEPGGSSSRLAVQRRVLWQTEILLPITTCGICNAMAFWFELQLDEETILSTGPSASKVGERQSAHKECNASCLHARSSVQSVWAWLWT